MHITKVTKNKKQYKNLLLLADEQEDMIEKYLNQGEMFVLHDNGVKAECVVVKLKEGIYEIKNLAVEPEAQRQGYGKALIEFLFYQYPDCHTLYVGTGESPLTLPFYKKCGFIESHRVKNFFTDNYDHPIYEDGIQLIDMIYLKRTR